jgi:hypothetical protein
VPLLLAALVVVAVVLRLYIGLRTPLDGDESAEGYAAVQVLHGHLVLMESDGRYLGALDSYVLAPFVLLFGPTAVAIRVCLALAGGAYVAITFALGRAVWRDGRRALLVAAIAGFFPLFALIYGVKARTYGLLLPIETLLLLAIVGLAWPARTPGRVRWALAGALAGLAVWHHPLLTSVVCAGGLVLLLRAPVLGWRDLRRGLAIAAVGFVAGWSPWLAYNLRHDFGSIRHLYAPATAYSIPMRDALGYFLSAVLPIFTGARVNSCGTQVAPTLAVDLGLLAVVATAFWSRRATLRALPRHPASIEPIDLVLLVGVLAVVAVTAGFFNALFCEPRYTMPLALPLAFVAALALAAWWSWPPGRVAAAALVAAWAVMAALTTSLSLRDGPDLVTTSSSSRRIDLPATVPVLEADRPEALIADFTLARELQYLAGGRLLVGEYGGYVGFPAEQQAALQVRHPSWLFLVGDVRAAALEAECARRGITYRKWSPAAGLQLYDRLSSPVLPDDLGIKTQRVDAV